jgi:periplasmic divalent cation tolerance protein
MDDSGNEMVLLYCPCPDAETPKRLGRRIVEARLAACANILPQMISVYHWRGAVEEATEAVLILKTRADRSEAAMEALLADHPYETPGVLVLPVGRVSSGYLAWLIGELALAEAREG